MSLQKKLLLLTVSMILLTVLAILGASEFFSRRTLALSVGASRELAASDLRHTVAGARELAESHVAATRLQRQTAVKNYLRSVADVLLHRVEEFHASLPPEQARQRIREALLGVTIGETGYVFGMDTRGVLTIHPKSEGRNLGDAAHIREMIRQREGFITYHSVTAGRDKAVFYRYFAPLDLIIAPGVFIDEMAGLYDLQAEDRLWAEFLARLREIRLGRSGSVWVLRTAGEGGGEFVLPPAGRTAGEVAAFPVSDLARKAQQVTDGEPVLHRFLAGGGQGEEAVMAALLPVPEKDWLIAASLPEEELLATSNRIADSFTALKLSMLGAAALTVLVASLLAGWIGRRSLAPLKRGVGFARKVAEGDLTVTLDSSSRDEVGALTGALNQMVDGIRSVVRRTQGTTSGLEAITGRLGEAAHKLEDLAGGQSGRADDLAAAIAEISASLREVEGSVSRLHEAADENTTSILELSSSIEEVSLNMQSVFQAGQEVSTASAEMAATSRQIADSTRQLEEAAGSTASAIFQMDAGVHSVEQTAAEMARISQGVLGDARTGRDAVEQTAAGIRDISGSMRDAGEVIRDLAERAASIGNIVSVIEDVAGEIDLLALNAAIIAAQAGAEGKGFAVVAEEIKELAGRTTGSTREIAEVVENVRGGIERAARLAGVVDDKTRSGEELVARAGGTLVKIVAGVEEVSRSLERMAGSVGEQARGSQAIKQASETVTSMVGQIVQATGEQEKASQDINRSAERLRELAEQVSASTREQSRASSLIARNTEGMNDLVQTIGRACTEQVKSSELILRTGEEVRSGARTLWQANQVLIDSVRGLRGEIGTLNGQVAVFRTGAGPETGDSGEEELPVPA